MFISQPHGGRVFVAERSPRRGELSWSAVPTNGDRNAGRRIMAGDVPRHIRKQAYKLFHEDRLRHWRGLVVDLASLRECRT